MEFLFTGNDYLSQFDDFKLVGRDQELERLVSILIRRYANSVIMTGAGGVGCTTLCLGIQAMKREPDAPLDILKKRLYFLDSDALFSLGDPEEISHAFHRIIRRLEQVYDSILIVEDTRDMIEACRNSGTLHVINALLVAVRNKDTQVIFETKDDDLDSVLKSHSDMRELFTILPIEEPTGENLVQIVKSSARVLEKHHGIKVTDDAIEAAIEFTTKYQTRDPGLSRAQPERSITLIDRAMSTYRLDVHRQPPGFTTEEWQVRRDAMRRMNLELRDGQNQIAELEDQRDKLIQRDKEISTPKPPETARTQIFQHGGFQTPEVDALSKNIRTLTDEVVRINARIGEMTAEINAKLALDRAMISREFSDISGIALDKLNQDDIAKLRTLDQDLKSRLYGQDHAIIRVTNGVKVARVGQRGGDLPLPFLFLGPSGVGKTELAKQLAAFLLDDEKALTRFDMSEYMEKHAVARLIGAPPGYEGFEAGGILTNAMRRNSYRVLLFDEIEKGHPDVFNIFLQVLGDGRLTDGLGRTVSFANAVLIMTTNIGQDHFLDDDLSDEQAEAAAMAELSSSINRPFRGEFLNRFAGRENIICFKKLKLNAIEKIVRREITSIDRVYGARGIHVEASNEVIAAFCKDQYDPKIGARGLPGFITAQLEPFIVDAILENQNIQATAQVDYRSDARHFAVHISKLAA